jgi:hypothetical protein
MKLLKYIVTISFLLFLIFSILLVFYKSEFVSFLKGKDILCSSEGEKIGPYIHGLGGGHCCNGLVPMIAGPDAGSICSKCGNNVCTPPEDKYQCPDDCK